MVGEDVNINYMTIEKTYKLTIKDTAFNLTEEEVSALYTECGKALKISVANPSYPPGVTKIDPVIPWPTYPYTHCGDVPFGTTDNSVMDWHNYHGVTGGIKSANVPSSKGINFLPDDMETIKDNNNWRSSVQKALDKLSAKTNVNFSTNKSGGTNIR